MTDDPFSSTDIINPETGRPNKTAIKKQMEALQGLAEKMLALPHDEFARLAIPDSVRQELVIASKMPNREARRRQIRHIAKRLSEMDLAEIEAQFDEIELRSRSFRVHQQQASDWLERIVADGGEIESFLNEFPAADRQQLRQLQRQALKDSAANKKGTSKEKLFHLLRQAIGEA